MAVGVGVTTTRRARSSAPYILVVEDDAALRDVLARALREEGHSVLTAADGRSAVASADAWTAAVVLDIGLPDADGRDVCHALRAKGIDAPVIFVTARDALHDRLAGFASGGDDYLTKPFHIPELLARVRVALKRGHPRPGTDASGTLLLDPATFQLRRGAESVAVSPTEFRLLARLIGRPGEVIRRRELIRAGWPDGAIVHENTLDQYVARIRKKLELVDATSKIETVRGVGYRFGA